MSESKQYFNNLAENWDGDTMRSNIARAVSGLIHKEVPLKKNAAMLDFGCGTGLVSLFFAPHLGMLHGLDTSEGMVDEFNRKAEADNFSNATAFMYHEGDDLRSNNYDIIVSSMVFHHLQEPRKILGELYGALKPGGVMAIADLDTEDGTFHPESVPGVFHHGFDREEFLGWFREAGLEEGKAVTAVSVPKNDKSYPIFLCIGKKPG